MTLDPDDAARDASGPSLPSDATGDPTPEPAPDPAREPAPDPAREPTPPPAGDQRPAGSRPAGRLGPVARERLRRTRAFLALAGRQIRQESARPLTTVERIGLAVILLAPVLFNAIALLPEITIPVPSVNDDMLHWLFIQRASEALASGQNVFDHWLPQIEMGLPQFFYYQHVPHLAVIVLERLTFGAIDLFTSFNLIRYVLLVGFPLTVFWSMRRMGFSGVAAAIAGGSAALLSNDFRYGFEYDSYTWRGFGLYTQLWGMHLSFITLACMYRLIQTGRGMVWAVLAFSLLALSHLIYAYMMAITVLVLFLYGLNRANVLPRVVRIGAVAIITGLISSYMVVPFALQSEYLNASPYLQQEKYDSYGIVAILRWLVTGDLLDHARLPVLSALFAVGVVGALVGRIRAALVAIALLVVWLVIYAGRPTLGPLVDLFPLSEGLLFHRFIGGVHLAAILLIGVGGAVLWQLFAPARARWQAAAAGLALLALLVPVYVERADFHALNREWMDRSMTAIEADADAEAVLATLATLPPGRVYAGLRANWGETMRFEDVKFYNLFPFEAIEGLPPPSESLSLNSDLIWDFHENELADYELFNVRYVIAPTPLPLPDFLRVVRETPRYTLYEAPSGGYAMYGAVVARQAFESQRDLFFNNRDWFRGRTLPAARQFIRYDYPARTAGPLAGTEGCPDGEVSFELFQPGRMDFVVGCPTDSSLIIKTTYHPNWRVSVDGQPVEAYMVSPSLIGVDLPAGRHSVTAEYRPGPLKLPLLLIGFAVLLMVLIAGPRLDDAVAVIVGRLPQPRFRFRASRTERRRPFAPRTPRGPASEVAAPLVESALAEPPVPVWSAEPEPEAQPGPEEEPEAESEAEAEPAFASEVEAQLEAEAGAEPAFESEVEAQLEAEAEAEPEPEAEIELAPPFEIDDPGERPSESAAPLAPPGGRGLVARSLPPPGAAIDGEPGTSAAAPRVVRADVASPLRSIASRALPPPEVPASMREAVLGEQAAETLSRFAARIRSRLARSRPDLGGNVTAEALVAHAEETAPPRAALPPSAPAAEVRSAASEASTRPAARPALSDRPSMASAAGSVAGRFRRPAHASARAGGLPPVPARTRLAGAMADRRGALPIVGIAIGSVLLYAIVYAAQRAINLDGSESSLNPKPLSQVQAGLRNYYLVTLALFLLYAWLIVLVWRRRAMGGLARTLLLGTPILVQVGLMLDRPYLSTDVLSYIAQGYVGIARGTGNAYSELVQGVLGTGVGDQLVALGWRPPPIPSPYGPLWADLEGAVMSLTTRVPLAILAFKLVATLASIGSIALVWRILGHVRPADRLFGTVLFAWNPVIIVELAGEGHNDALMLFFALAGILATVRLKPAATLVATSLGVLTKYVPALLLPPQLVYLWRRRTDRRSFFELVGLGAAASLILALVAFAPVWVGLQTFEGVRVSGEPGPWPTISGAVFRFLGRSRPELDAGLIVRVLVQGLFVAFVAIQSLRVRTSRGMLEACAKGSVAYLLLGSTIYFPWYAVLPIALLALSPGFGTIALIGVISVMSRVISPLVDLRPEYNPIPIAAFQLTNAGILIGLFVFIVILMWGFLGWASRDDEARRPHDVSEFDWFLARFDRRIGLPAVARRRLGPSAFLPPLTAPPIELMSPEEVAARTAAPPRAALPGPAGEPAAVEAGPGGLPEPEAAAPAVPPKPSRRPSLRKKR